MKKEAGFVRKKLHQVFSALAYEHSGEMLSIPKKYQKLSDDLTDSAVKDNQSEKKKR